MNVPLFPMVKTVSYVPLATFFNGMDVLAETVAASPAISTLNFLAHVLSPDIQPAMFLALAAKPIS